MKKTGLWIICLLVAGCFLAACMTKFEGENDADGDAETPDVIGEDGTDTEVSPDCGNGTLDEGEECDDGNRTNEDGCDNDCTYSCSQDSDCRDEDLCNGVEACNLTDHTCNPGTNEADGFVCIEDPRSICLDGECGQSICGDDFIDTGAGESCEPPGEGSCNTSCHLRCTGDPDCPDDGNPCNGEEYCNLTDHICANRNPPIDGSPCGTPPPRRICRLGTCQESHCGDGFIDRDALPAEECEDGNMTDGDGCENDCTNTCHGPEDCQDVTICNGEEICGEQTDRGRACAPSASWPIAGTGCEDDSVNCTLDVCNDSGGCGHDQAAAGWCIIGESCVSEGSPNPTNECRECIPTINQYDWSNSDPSRHCTDDDRPCTRDNCNGTGGCDHILFGDNCLIGGICYDLNDPNPLNQCEACRSGSRTDWTIRDGEVCDDTNYCTRHEEHCTPAGQCGTIEPYLYGVLQIDGGGYYTCIKSGVNGAKCWGNNGYGQLGNGTDVNSFFPVDVIGITSGLIQISAGEGHTCAVTVPGGGVKCWGNNGNGRLGNGGTANSWTPVDVVGLTDMKQVCAGGAHSCAVDNSGYAWCWGSNNSGQLGHGVDADSPTPVPVWDAGVPDRLQDVEAISCGNNHTCARIVGGTMMCWGDNNLGQLGDNTYGAKAYPTFVAASSSGGSLAEVTGMALGFNHTCAIVSSAGSVMCWGWNLSGQLGNGTTDNINYPVETVPSINVDAIAAGWGHTCALTKSSSMLCWGSNSSGELGDGLSIDSSNPMDVMINSTTPLSGVTLIGLGLYHSCAYMGTVDVLKCWGSNNQGQLGIGSMEGTRHPWADNSVRVLCR